MAEDRVGALVGAVGHATVAAAERLTDPDPEGWLRLRLELSWPDEVHHQLLSAGSSIEVLEPPEVRERLIATATRIAARYVADGPVDGRRPTAARESATVGRGVSGV